MRGGYASCPTCNKAVPVPGGPEPLFWLLLSGAIALSVIIAGAAWTVEPAAGLVVLAVAALVITISVIAS